MGNAKCWPRGRMTTTNRTWQPQPIVGLSMYVSQAIQVLGSSGPEVLLSHKDQHWESWPAWREVPAESWCLGSPLL